MSYGTLNISSINGSGLENNYFINPEFTINQRGAATPTTTANAYNYDRWYYDGTYLYQGIENNNLRNTTYTISWTGSATASYSLNTASSSSQSGQTYTSITSGSNITISSLGSNTLWIRFSAQPTQPKLELGSAQTTFVPRLYGQELALCQRYYQLIGQGFTGSVEGTTSISINEKFLVQMRASPSTSIVSGQNCSIRYLGGDVTNSSPTLTAPSSNINGLWTLVNGFTTLTTNTPVQSRNNTSNTLFISVSAEL